MRLRRIGVQKLLFLVQEVALAIDLDGLEVAQRRFRMAVWIGDALLEELGRQLVIMGKKHEILSGRKPGHASEIPGHPAIGLAAVRLDTGILGHILAANRLRTVGR